MNLLRKATFVAGATALFGLAAVPAQADFLFEFGVVVTGDTPGGDEPWATLLCQDTAAGEVTFTLTHSGGSTAGQFLSELNLNFNGDIPQDFAFATGDTNKITGAEWNEDAFNDAGSRFDIRLSFETSNQNEGENRIKPGESVSWTFTGTDVDCEDFHVLSNPNGDGPGWLALLHVQGIGEGFEGSGKVAPVPEPASMAALGLGALGLLARRRRK